MSGIAGLLNLEGGPVDAKLLDRLTKLMRFRGPDAVETWVGGRVGFGHAMLRAAVDARGERQPCSLDGRVWIVADARVDGRAELFRKLLYAGHECAQDTNDAELILYAYRAWGEACVRHLIGDFAFLVWDADRQRLFCARDHLGVKPFYYARVRDGVVFSNTLSCVKAHPGVSGALDDLAVSDFLLYGLNQDEAATAFADIRRLPPGHTLTCSQGALRVDRYWSLPSGGHVRYRHAGDYIEHFRETLNASVADRLRCDRVGVLMSGGLDSTSIAATAHAQLSARNRDFDLRAYTCVYDRLIPDDERRFAGEAARALDIPIHYLVADDYGLFDRWREPGMQPPEPVDHPLSALAADQMIQVAAGSRVALTGWDGDAVLNGPAQGRRDTLFKGRQLARRVAMAACRALWPRRWSRLRRLEASPPAFVRPEWLKPEFVERLDLARRWQSIQENAQRDERARTFAHRALTSPALSWLLEGYDAGVTRLALDVRHPLLDIRLVEYVLSIPPVPWCVDKRLLREAMRDRLPDPVRLRAKTPLAGDPLVALLRGAKARWIDDFEPAAELGRYVDRAAIPALGGADGAHDPWTHLRPLCLNLWLQYSGRVHYRAAA